MSSLPGGAADKAGNQYEYWWTALRIVDVLEGRASRIRLEPPGADGVGVEFEIDHDGATWVEQVKDATADGNWTLNRLKREQVLEAAKAHASAGRMFRLVVSSAAPSLANLSDRARATESFAEFAEVLTGPLVADLKTLAAEWDLGGEDAWTLLKRVHVEHHARHSMRRLVTTTFRMHFASDPDVVVAELRRFCDDHLHVSVTAPMIRAHLDSKGFARRRLVGDTSVAEALHNTVQRHGRRVAHAQPLVGLVPRNDAGDILERLRDPDCRQVVLVDGRAGCGKSTVAAEVAATLDAQGWFVAVARMDGVETTTNTSNKLGTAIGLTDSPTVLLAGVAHESPALLVIDQLDAISTYSGRMADSFDSVDEVLHEMAGFPNVKILMLVRTVDLKADTRLRNLVAGPAGVERHTIGDLDHDAVLQHLAATGMVATGATLELLRTPLHFAVFSRLSEAARTTPYQTLQDLYSQYTDEVRGRISDRTGRDNWLAIVGSLVEAMSNSETLSVPGAVLDRHNLADVQAMGSESVIVRDRDRVAFFHESYFDYLFSRGFVSSGGDPHRFLAESGQHLFRRAQARQILEHLAATDRRRFRVVVAQLLASTEIRSHLKDVVIGVLSQLDPDSDDWTAIDEVAWSGSPISPKIVGLLSQPGWFDAADALGLWEPWLADPARVDAAFYPLILTARKRPGRVGALVRPHIGTTEEWRLRLRALISWSLRPELVDLAVDLLERGQLDDARGPIAVNSDFWSIVYGLADDAPDAAARLIGARLDRGLALATAAGQSDPFESKHISTHTQSGSMIADVAKAAPAAFIEHVLPFVVAVATGDQRVRDGLLPVGKRWGHRYISAHYGVDDAVFFGVEEALCRLAVDDPNACDLMLKGLLSAESEELRFLACRALRVRGAPDVAAEWLLSDVRNLALGWADSPRWASRDLIEACSRSCSAELYDRLERALLGYSAPWESIRRAGFAQYELLSALDATRLSDAARRRLGELHRRFRGVPPQIPQVIEAHEVASPIGEAASEHMSDDDWLRALRTHTSDETDWSGPVPVGGARELAQVLGRRAAEAPSRFAGLALQLDAEVPACAIESIIRGITGKVDDDLVTDVCEHAYRSYGPEVGRTVCYAITELRTMNPRLIAMIEAYADDADPEYDRVRAEADDGQRYEDDLYNAGLNSTRGLAALAAAPALLAIDEHRDRLVHVVEKLANDDTLAVRVCAAQGVFAMLNSVPDRALDTAERLFDTSIDVHAAHSTERLLTLALLRAPDRFASTLSQALGGPEYVAIRAGRVWAVAVLRDALPSAVAVEVGELPPAARRGAAQRFARNVAGSVEVLGKLFDDTDAEVRKYASRAVHRLNELPADDQERLISAFLASKASATHLNDLIRALEDMTTTLPPSAITACVRAVDELKMGSASAQDLVTHDLIAVVLRLYRQSHADGRAQCLDLVDRLTELNVYGVAEALESER